MKSVKRNRRNSRRLLVETLECRRLLTAAPHPLDLSTLDGDNGFRLEGTLHRGNAGRVSDAGDVNGDGLDDWIIGAPGGQWDEDDFSSAYVVFGKEDAFPPASSLDQIDGSNGFQMRALSTGVELGISIAGAGDVNGDGYDDVLVGDDDTNEEAGAAYLVFGKATGFDALVDLDALDGSDGFRMIGQDANEKVGWTLDGAGDFNGDGYDDVIIGVEHTNSMSPFGGGADSLDTPYAAYVVFGKQDGFNESVSLSNLDGTNGFKIEDTFQNGRPVTGAGDINGDGLSDIMIGHRSDGVYVLFGQAADSPAVFHVADLDGDNGFHLNGGTGFGLSVNSAGDVNGDGVDDLIIGGWGHQQGDAYVVFGSTDAFPANWDVDSLDGTNGFRLVGEANDEIYVRQHFGVDVSSAGDFNADGYDDLLIGTRLDGNEFYNHISGYSYVVFGRPDGFSSTIQAASLDGSDGLRIDAPIQAKIGGTDHTRGGEFVSSAGDINGDGYDDLLIGAIEADVNATIPFEGLTNAGFTYVVYGGDYGVFAPDVTAETISGNLVIQGNDEANHLRVSDVDSSTLRIEGLDGTTINGQSEFLFHDSFGSTVTISTGKGADSLIFHTQFSFGAPRFVVDTGSGRDYLELSSSRFDVNTGRGNDHVIIHIVNTINTRQGDLNLNTGNGNDRVHVDTPENGEVDFSAEIFLGDGDDIFDTDRIGHGGSVRLDGHIDGGVGTDKRMGYHFAGNVEVLNFEEEVTCPPEGCFVGGDLTTEIVSDPDIGNILVIRGNDQFDHDLRLSSLAPGQVTVESSGYDATINGVTAPVSFNDIARVKVVTGSGSDSVLATGLLLSDKLIVNTGLGDDDVQIVGGILEKLKIDTSGGDDVILIDAVTINRRTNILTGWGDDDVTIRDSIFGRRLTLKGGLDDDTLHLLGANLFSKGHDDDFENVFGL